MLLLSLIAVGGCPQAEKAVQQVNQAAEKAKVALDEVKEAGKGAQRTVKKVIAAADALRELLPADIIMDEKRAASTLSKVLRMQAPQGYRARAVLKVTPAGLPAAELVLITPARLSVSQLLTAKDARLQLTPGRHTLMATGRLGIDHPPLLARGMAKLMGLDDNATLRLKTTKVGNQRVTFYEQQSIQASHTTPSHTPLTARLLFLDEGRVLYFLTSTGRLDEQAFQRTASQLVKAWPKDKHLFHLMQP